MLLVVEGFSWATFLTTTITCALGIGALGIAMTGYFLTTMGRLPRLVLGFAGLLSMAPSLTATAVGLALGLPVLALNWLAARGTAPAAQPR
jgi:TRAP-type uncharacterized transport system fused permease subunit